MRNVLTAIRASKTVDRESGENKSIELLSRGSSLQHLLKAVENIQRQNYIPYKILPVFLVKISKYNIFKILNGVKTMHFLKET